MHEHNTKAKYMALRKKGMGYSAIARELGVSRQAVYCSLHYKPQRRGVYTPDRVRYPALRAYMAENHMSIHRLKQLTGSDLRYRLSHGRLTREQAKKVSDVTGIPVSELLRVAA